MDTLLALILVAEIVLAIVAIAMLLPHIFALYERRFGAAEPQTPVDPPHAPPYDTPRDDAPA